MEFPAVALSLIVALRMSPLAAGTELQPHMPNVCAEQQLGVVGLRQPCVQAARVWQQDCGGRRWCAGYERRVVYYTGYRQVYQLRSQTTYRCCPGWSQLAGDAGCLHTGDVEKLSLELLMSVEELELSHPQPVCAPGTFRKDMERPEAPRRAVESLKRRP